MSNIPNVTVVQAAVWDRNGTVNFSGPTQSASVSDTGEEVAAITLDDFFLGQGIPKIDFIKMDIEGAEEQALRGASSIIKRFQPKMAISAYHKIFDVLLLPSLILEIEPGYSFKLRHYSDGPCETVLYCIPDNSMKNEKVGVSPGKEDFSGTLCGPTAREYGAFFAHLVPFIQNNMRVGKGQDELMEQLPKIAKSLESASETIQRLLSENKQLGEENIALRSILSKIKKNG